MCVFVAVVVGGVLVVVSDLFLLLVFLRWRFAHLRSSRVFLHRVFCFVLVVLLLLVVLWVLLGWWWCCWGVFVVGGVGREVHCVSCAAHCMPFTRLAQHWLSSYRVHCLHRFRKIWHLYSFYTLHHLNWLTGV